jgi:hypothetical protein
MLKYYFEGRKSTEYWVNPLYQCDETGNCTLFKELSGKLDSVILKNGIPYTFTIH